jgi:hypothetical protein
MRESEARAIILHLLPCHLVRAISTECCYQMTHGIKQRARSASDMLPLLLAALKSC